MEDNSPRVKKPSIGEFLFSKWTNVVKNSRLPTKQYRSLSLNIEEFNSFRDGKIDDCFVEGNGSGFLTQWGLYRSNLGDIYLYYFTQNPRIDDPSPRQRVSSFSFLPITYEEIIAQSNLATI